MTDWKKTYSTWFNGALVLAGIVTAIVQYLQSVDNQTPIAVAIAGVITVILRSLPQTPSEPKETVRLVEKEDE